MFCVYVCRVDLSEPRDSCSETQVAVVWILVKGNLERNQDVSFTRNFIILRHVLF